MSRTIATIIRADATALANRLLRYQHLDCTYRRLGMLTATGDLVCAVSPAYRPMPVPETCAQIRGSLSPEFFVSLALQLHAAHARSLPITTAMCFAVS